MVKVLGYGQKGESSKFKPHFKHVVCCNVSFGLATKAKTCKDVGQERSSGVKSHAPRSVGECEGMNLHTPK